MLRGGNCTHMDIRKTVKADQTVEMMRKVLVKVQAETRYIGGRSQESAACGSSIRCGHRRRGVKTSKVPGTKGVG